MRPGRPDTAQHRDVREGRGTDPRAIQAHNRIERQRQEVQQWRNNHRSDWDHYVAVRNSDRNDWRSHRAWRPRPNLGWVVDHGYWGDRYDSWEDTVWAPPVYVEVPVAWPVPMPEYPEPPLDPSQPDYSTVWTYQDVANVALNLESVTRDMYDQMDAVIDSNPNQEYATRLMNVLADLVDASENYTDAVNNGTDWSDSLDQLFYLESEMKLARTTLSGYSKEYLVSDDETALNEYVEELLWTYKANYNSGN